MHVFGYYVVCDMITPNISDMHTLFTIKTPFRPNAVNHLRFNLSKHILRPWSILGKTLGFMYSQKICLVWVLQKINWNIYFDTCIYIYIFRCGSEVYMAPRIYTYSLHQIHAQRGTFNASRFSNKSVSLTQFYSCCKINMFCTPHIYVLYNFYIYCRAATLLWYWRLSTHWNVIIRVSFRPPEYVPCWKQVYVVTTYRWCYYYKIERVYTAESVNAVARRNTQQQYLLFE